jgi:hypothetical protein
MQYKDGKNYTEFIREIVIDSGKDRCDIEDECKNAKKVLKKILTSLDMKNVLYDKKYQRNNKKFFPVHFQILCKVLLSQNRSRKEDFIYKINHDRVEEITEEEILDFCNQIRMEFKNWFESLEYEKKEEREREKEKLDEIFNEMEKCMIEDQSTEEIDTLESGGDFTENEVSYLKKKFRIRMESNIFSKDLEDKIYYNSQKKKIIKKMHDCIDEELKYLLNLDELDGRITLLDEWKSETLDGIPLSREYIGKGDYLTNKEKCDILSDLTKDCIDTIKYNKIYIDGYKKNRKKDADLKFSIYKKEVKADEINTFIENIFLDDEDDDVEVIKRKKID